MRADVDLGRIAIEEQLEGRDRRADPRVVGDASTLERDVQVGPHEDAPPADIGVADRARLPH
jgi:hypothetical protein